MLDGKVYCEIKSQVSPDKLYVIMEFNHYQKHFMFTMEGADFKNKKIDDKKLVDWRTIQ